MHIIVVGIVLFVLILISDINYRKNFNKYKNLAIIYFFAVIINYIFISNIGFIKELLESSTNIFFDKIGVFMLGMALTHIEHPLIFQLIQRDYEEKVINQIEKEIKVNADYDYYRDVFKNISPAILSFCYNRKIIVSDTVIAVLLSLQMRNIIKIEDNKINILKDIDKENLLNHEKYIVKFFNNEKRNIGELAKELISDLKNGNYICKTDRKEFSATYIILGIPMVFLLFFSLLFGAVLPENSSSSFIILIAYFLNFAAIYICDKMKYRKNPIIRTQKALEISAKLKGLKKYIQDFSLIQNNGIDNIKLYEEYVIYAIIFNLPGKLNDDAKILYENIVKNL